MIQIHKTAIMPYSAAQLYHLVLTVEDYPLFLPWCVGTVLHEQTETVQEASITVQKSFVRTVFRTRNTLEKNRSIVMQLIEGPFTEFVGRWNFLSLNEQGSQIHLDLHIQVQKGALGTLLEPTFSKIAQTLLQAFCDRAHYLYRVSQ